jgi:hypothetical protein
MFRVVLAVLGVALLFGGAVYASGDYLDTWESPTSASRPHRKAKPEPKKAKAKVAPAKPKAKRRPAPRRKVHRKPAWLTQLNTLCRRGDDQAAAIPAPITPEGALDYFRQIGALAKRWNRRAAPVLRIAARQHPRDVERLLRLFREEERLIDAIVSAADRGKYRSIAPSARSLAAVGQSENRILRRMHATDCTISENPFRL